MKRSGRVAIITRTKDRPLFLPRAARSVQAQSFRDFVWVVVNDGGRRGEVEALADEVRGSGVEVRVVHHDRCLGMEAASNAGVAAADSEFIVIHDDDDSWYPGFLESTVSFLDSNANHQAVVCWADEIKERVEGDALVFLSKKSFHPRLKSVFLADLISRNLFPPIALLFRRAAYQAVGPFDETLPVLGDWEFNVRLAMHGDIGVIRDTLACYHIRENAPLQGNMGNSITSGQSLHEACRVILHNRWLRHAMATGLGPGNIVAMAHLLKTGRKSCFSGVMRFFRNVFSRWI